MESILSRVFSYRQRENHSPTENYLIEAFAFCLESDELFRKEFLNKIIKLNYSNQSCEITTQTIYADYGRPDIEINYEDTSILVECKVEAKERVNQLEDYTSILLNEKTQSNKHLVFLTKYFEHRTFINCNVGLHIIRWYDIYTLINSYHKDITKQLKLFLEELDMDTVKNFSIQDMLALSTITGTISKMDELLLQLRPEFEKEFGSFSRESTLDYGYDVYSTLKYQSKVYYIAVGFIWGDENEIPQFGIWFNFPKKNFENTDIIKFLSSKLSKKKGWAKEDIELLRCMRPISDFITQQEEDCIPNMKRFVQDQLRMLYELRKINPKFLKK